MTEPSLRERLAEVEARIAAAATRAGRDPTGVEIVAVAKGFPAAAVAEAVRAGVRAVGENRAQELLLKRLALDSGDRPPEWHFVGRIQRNKIRRLAALVDVWHSVDRVEVGKAIAASCPGARVYAQVNLGGEEQKGGCPPDDVEELLAGLAAHGLMVEGLMTVPPVGDDPRAHFAALRRLATTLGCAGLSMGMSADFEVAVEEGATSVRLGSILFGPRPR